VESRGFEADGSDEGIEIVDLGLSHPDLLERALGFRFHAWSAVIALGRRLAAGVLRPLATILVSTAACSYSSTGSG
jgi:hypothetical protein